MSREQVIDLMEHLQLEYSTFKVTPEMINIWVDYLQVYDEEDVKERLKEIKESDRFQNGLPTMDYITKTLIPKHEKIDMSKMSYRCNICGRYFNDYGVYDKHFDRCSSVRYYIKQCKRWHKTVPAKNYLYNLSDEEFNQSYNNLLHFIYDNTTDKFEKERIGFIFNPPTQEKAREYLKTGGVGDAT